MRFSGWSTNIEDVGKIQIRFQILIYSGPLREGGPSFQATPPVQTLEPVQIKAKIYDVLYLSLLSAVLAASPIHATSAITVLSPVLFHASLRDMDTVIKTSPI